MLFIILRIAILLHLKSTVMLSCSIYSNHYCSRFRHNIKIIHFLGSAKPWHHTYVENEDNIIFYPGTNQSEYGAVEFIKKWWKVYKSAQAQHCIEQIESTTVATEVQCYITVLLLLLLLWLDAVIISCFRAY